MGGYPDDSGGSQPDTTGHPKFSAQCYPIHARRWGADCAIRHGGT